MKSSKRVVKAALSGALVLAMGITTLFTNAGSSYAAGEVKLNKTSRNILTQRSFDFNVEGAAADAKVTWKSSDEKIASVNEDGVVTGIKKGDVTITCEVEVAGKVEELTAAVKIRKPAVKIEIKNKITELEYGKTYDLNRTLTPKTSNDVTTWKSSDTKIATVDKNGVVKALKDGTVTITATTMSGRSDSVKITVFGTPIPGATATPKPEKPQATATPKPVKLDTVFEESFEKGVGGFVSRGGVEKLTAEKAGSAQDGKQYLKVTGRTSNWNGAAVNLNSVVELGGVYNVSAWVKQDANDGEVLKATTANTFADGPKYIPVGTVTTKKGEWTEITGKIEVAKDVTDIVFYFEADTLIDFMVDKIVITKVSGGSKPVVVAPTTDSYDITKLQPAGYDYTQDGNKISLAKKYAEAMYIFPTALKVSDYKTMKVGMTDATGEIAVILYDESNTRIAVWYGQVADAEFDLTKSMGVSGAGEAIDQNAKIAKIGFMANNSACEVKVTGISFQ